MAPDNGSSSATSKKLERRVRREIRLADYTAAIFRRMLWLMCGKVEPPSKWLAPGSERLPIEHEEASFEDGESDEPR